MARIKLDIAPDPQVSLVGISSHENDYRLCWSLNHALGIDLRRRRNDISTEGADRSAHHAVFDHEDPDFDVRWTLVNNHGDQGLLLKEQRMADYFLLVDEEAGIAMDDLLDRLRSTEFVLTAFPLDLRNLRGGHMLLQ